MSNYSEMDLPALIINLIDLMNQSDAAGNESGQLANRLKISDILVFVRDKLPNATEAMIYRLNIPQILMKLDGNTFPILQCFKTIAEKSKNGGDEPVPIEHKRDVLLGMFVAGVETTTRHHLHELRPHVCKAFVEFLSVFLEEHISIIGTNTRLKMATDNALRILGDVLRHHVPEARIDEIAFAFWRDFLQRMDFSDWKRELFKEHVMYVKGQLDKIYELLPNPKKRDDPIVIRCQVLLDFIAKHYANPDEQRHRNKVKKEVDTERVDPVESTNISSSDQPPIPQQYPMMLPARQEPIQQYNFEQHMNIQNLLNYYQPQNPFNPWTTTYLSPMQNNFQLFANQFGYQQQWFPFYPNPSPAFRDRFDSPIPGGDRRLADLMSTRASQAAHTNRLPSNTTSPSTRIESSLSTVASSPGQLRGDSSAAVDSQESQFVHILYREDPRNSNNRGVARKRNSYTDVEEALMAMYIYTLYLESDKTNLRRFKGAGVWKEFVKKHFKPRTPAALSMQFAKMLTRIETIMVEYHVHDFLRLLKNEYK
ncbi:unnamed protein product [Caenorhabditis bovis]|uniref:Uncharacterized protein n=1 Tax=Caenorhabditis bovis TaxID=2654633 RepID=A0A8S1EM94_9PELO|nr:unnamed protein product [Caenorhabditis bovis]